MTQQSNTTNLPDGTHIGRTALSVSDCDVLTDFYRTTVGLEVLTQSATAATLGIDGTALLTLTEADNDETRPSGGTGLYHNAFKVPSRAALGDALLRVNEHWQLQGASHHGVSEALYFADPDGNGVEIYRDLPRDEWPRTGDGGVDMVTDPLDLELVRDAAGGGSTVPPGTTVGHVHLEVSSLDAFLDFYVDTLGFELAASMPAARFVAAGDYHHHLGANTWNRRTEPNTGTGLSWFEIVVPSKASLDSLREQLDDRGVPVIERDEGIQISDPDDITILLRSESPKSPGDANVNNPE